MLIQIYTGTPVFIAALFAVTKIWKQLMSITDEWIKEDMMYTHTHGNTTQP